ncbi:MAG: c-type cytochrome [Gemmatimonadota bacterium]
MMRYATGRRRCWPRFAGKALALVLAGTLSLAVSPAAAMQAPSAAVTAQADASQGQMLYETKCAACHSLGADRLVGPGLADVTTRRETAWLDAFITDPAPMLAGGDSIAVALLAEYQLPMPALGLTDDEVDAILAFLEAPTPVSGGATSEAADGDATTGRALFTGEKRLANGGPACLSCHSAVEVGLAGGGNLAVDLSPASAKYGAALPGVLGTAPFPVMQDVFADHPLTGEEIADLAAFLGARSDEVRATAASSALAFPMTGLGGAVALLLLAGVLWRGRLRGVRKPLIGGHR